ncbi:MAG: hypothetical protein ACO3LT_01445 [Ilumatobacteraceae bacterium]
MSYVPSHRPSAGEELGKPNALTVIEHTGSTTQTVTAGNKIDIGTVHNWYGSFTPTISNNIFTLPSGYWYYIESAVQSYVVGTLINNIHFSFQHYDETSSADLGTLATNFGVYGASQDTFLYSRDACAKALIDCTTSAMDVSIRVSSYYVFDRINYNSGQEYSGLGRTVIWQLNA